MALPAFPQEYDFVLSNFLCQQLCLFMGLMLGRQAALEEDPVYARFLAECAGRTLLMSLFFPGWFHWPK